jgi:PTS system nitrogen regulatory IIA component
LITLNEPVGFESVDDQPVDILFALVAPEEGHDEHLKALSSIAERLNTPAYRERLRSSKDAQELFKNAIEFNAP